MSERLFSERVKDLGLPLDQLIVIGSGILNQLGIRQSADIDVATNREALEEIARSEQRDRKSVV